MSKSTRRGSTSRGAPKQSASSQLPPSSFLFVVNEIIANDDPEADGSVTPQYVDGRWRPPLAAARGFREQTPGYVYRWQDGEVTWAEGYGWSGSGTLAAPQGIAQPECYRTATVFYCNHFDNFFATPGDAEIQDMAASEWGWRPLQFHHNSTNTSYVDFVAEKDHLAVSNATWIGQLLPEAYCSHNPHGPTTGGLAGNLSLLVALVAFSCAPAELSHVLLQRRAWRRREWRNHNLYNGRQEGRGVVVSVFKDPENPAGSTTQSLVDFEGSAVFR